MFWFFLWYQSVYNAIKSGLIGLTRSFALELSPHNVFVNCVSPGFFDTELTRRVLGEEGMEEMRKRVPAGKLGDPQWVADLVCFLAADKNQYITGQNIVIDGGFICE